MLFDVDRSFRVKKVPVVLRELENAHDAVEKDIVVLDDIAIGAHLSLRLEIYFHYYGGTCNRVLGCPLGDRVVQLYGKEELPAIETLQRLRIRFRN